MGKMSDVQRYAKAIGKDVRTVRRQCRAEKIRAWRDDKGQWRIDPRLIQIEEMRQKLRDYLGPPTERNKRMFEATLFAHGIDRCDDKNQLREYHSKLLREAPKKWRFLYLNYQHDKKACLAVDDPLEWVKQQVQRRRSVPKVKKVKEMLDVARLKEEDQLAWLRFRIDQQVQKLGRVPKIKELEEMLDVSRAQLYRAERGLIKKLKRRFSHDPTAPIHLPGGVQVAATVDSPEWLTVSI